MSTISIVTKFATTDALSDNLFDGLIEANRTFAFGSPTWTDISKSQARGTFTSSTDGSDVRVVIVDRDTTTAKDAFDITAWVNG